jgi:hypothetical protein
MAAALLLIVPAAGAMTAYQAILEAEEAGELTVDDTALYLAYSVLAPERLPADYAALETETCGTPALHEAWLRLDETSAPVREEILSLANRPSYGGAPVYTIDSDGGYFKIHWTDTGTHQTTESYAQEIADAADVAWEVQLDELGYYQPPSDQGLGGDEKYDIYVQNLPGTTLGYCTCAGEPSDPTTPNNDKASHIVMSTGVAYNTKICTVSHEFQHACQMAADAAEPTWFMENCAVWIEEQVWPEIDDYLMYTSSEGGLRRPMWDIRTSPGGLYHYGAFTYPWFMENAFNSVDVVLEVWQNCADVWGANMLEAQIDMFENHGTTFENAFMYYGYYRWCTAGNWYDGCGLYDSEAASWSPGPLVLPDQFITELPQDSLADYIGVAGDTYEIECYGIHYYKIDLSDYQDGWVTFEFDGRDNFEWNIASIMYSDAGNSSFDWYDVEAPANEISLAVETTGWDYAIIFPAFMSDTGLDPYYNGSITYSTGVEDGAVTPAGLSLSVSANPLTTAGSVSIDMPQAGMAELRVFDMSGRRVATLCREELAAGTHSFGLDGLDLGTGTYLFNIVSGRSSATAKAVLVR